MATLPIPPDSNPHPWEPTAEDLAAARRSLDKNPPDRELASAFALGYVDQALATATEDASVRDSCIRRARAMLAALKDWKPGEPR